MTVIRQLGLLALAIGLVVALTAPAAATTGSLEVTRGRVTTLEGGEQLGYELQGRAVMVRSASTTVVVLRVRGLEANTTYPAHVHNAPCSSTPPGGGHYQHEIGGPVDAANEIWPAVSTNNTGRGWGAAWHGHRARADAMSIVIHYPPDTSIRLACIDLS
jgi:Cu-Zn family superoxide dismutase